MTIKVYTTMLLLFAGGHAQANPTESSRTDIQKRYGDYEFKIEGDTVFRKKVEDESEWQKLYQGAVVGAPAAIAPKDESEIYLFTWGSWLNFSSGLRVPTMSNLSIPEGEEDYKILYDPSRAAITTIPLRYLMKSNFWGTDPNAAPVEHRIDMMLDGEVLYILFSKGNRGGIVRVRSLDGPLLTDRRQKSDIFDADGNLTIPARHQRPLWEMLTLFEDDAAEEYSLLAVEEDGSIRLSSPKSVAVVAPLERKVQIILNELIEQVRVQHLDQTTTSENHDPLAAITPQTLSRVE